MMGLSTTVLRPWQILSRILGVKLLLETIRICYTSYNDSYFEGGTRYELLKEL